MFKNIKRASFKHKNNKLLYYVKNYLRLLLPLKFYQSCFQKKQKNNSVYDNDPVIQARINYYNKLSGYTPLSTYNIPIKDFKMKEYKKVYFFDTFEHVRYFPGNLKFTPLFGDITYTPEYPVLVKSRPIYGDNTHSVVLNLVKIRHFLFINDKTPFERKKNMMVFRGKAHQPHRMKFLEMYHKHPLCNIGQVNHTMNLHFVAPRLTIGEHLKYKFILCLEGNDVASNLKWVMSSNSLAVMPKPKYETWFMEGTLIPDYHYVCIKDDYSDLEEKLTYYIEHPQEGVKIIENAHRYVNQFRDKKVENYISFKVLEKYFRMTGQIE